MLDLLERIATRKDTDNLDDLIELIQLLRPKKKKQVEGSIASVRTLIQLLKGNPTHAAALRHYFQKILLARRQTSLYTDVGILSNDGFFTELYRRLNYRVLPPALDDMVLCDCLDIVFFANIDYQWIQGIPAPDWLELFDVLANANVLIQEVPVASVPTMHEPVVQKILIGILEAIRTLSYRISATGLEPSLIRIHPDIDKYESPFLMQNVEVNLYLESYAHYLTGDVPTTKDALHIVVMLEQCDTVVAKIRKNALHLGTSVALTYLLVTLTQSIDRMRTLLSVINISTPLSLPAPDIPNESTDIPKSDIRSRRRSIIALAMELIEAHNKKYAINALLTNNIHLLARNITENASRTGEHYIAENRQEYGTMFRTSAGAGFIIGFMAMIKILLSYLRAAPLVEAFLYSMNYSFGFMLVHILQFTIATKQPAMTASRIASGLHSQDGRNIDLDSMADLIIKVLRTQLVAVIGNLVVVIPTAYLIAIVYFRLSGAHLVSSEKAQHLLHDIDPFSSWALFYAAIAGVCLFTSGLISGYYDNRALYTRMAQRVEQVRSLRRLLGEKKLAYLAHYVEDNLGGLMGNFFFGIMLGSVGTLGYLMGLPLDIRHITFSAANFSISVVGLEHHLAWPLVATSIAGIISIGAVNLAVSFGLALLVALRSRRGQFNHKFLLIKTLLKRFAATPTQFFIPPLEPANPTGGELVQPNKDR